MKKVASLFLAVLMIFTVAVTAFAAPNKKQTEIINEYNIVRLEEIAGENGKSADPTIIILSEEELLEQGENVKDLFNKAEMLYVLTDMSNSAIQRVCNLPALVSSDDVQDSKFATAITKDSNGNYAFSNVSALYVDTTTNSVAEENFVIPETNKVYDGIEAVLKNTEKKPDKVKNGVMRMQADDFDAHANDSAVVYDTQGNRIGTMGYTAYWYKILKSGSNRIFDVITVATFAPDFGYKCAKMSVYLGTNKANHEVLEAANIVSNGESTTHSISLSAQKKGITGGGSTSWTYTVDAQTVTKQFDMQTNDRTWIFKPKNAGNGDAWIEEPGIRMCATQERCYTTVTLSCPFVTILGIELNENTLSRAWYIDY